MAKKTRSTAQFDTLVIKEKDDNGVEHEKTVRERMQIEWEVRIFYWNLYKKEK